MKQTSLLRKDSIMNCSLFIGSLTVASGVLTAPYQWLNEALARVSVERGMALLGLLSMAWLCF
jgi:hypothetical protein